MNRLKSLANFVFVILFACPCLAQENDPWEPLDLGSAKLEGATLHYDKSFSSNVDSLSTSFQEFLDEESDEGERMQKLLEKKKEIIEDVNRILGFSPSESQKAEQDRVLTVFLRPKFSFGAARGRTELYLLKKDTVKDYLRKGGSLPGFAYDKASDTASYNFFASLSDPAPEEGISLALPLSGVETLEKEAKEIFKRIAQWGGVREGAAFHELIEFTIMNQQLRPYDPYFRWFSDGFANAIAARLLQKYVSKDAAKEFARDRGKYSDLEKEINLYYWMGPDFCIDTPLESEDRLDNARYAYATFEAERLIDKYGIECVATILDEACKQPVNNSRNLVAAVKEVTGEDIEHRFRRYQTFETKEEGIKKYATAFNESMSRKDYSEALVNLLRVQELRGPGLRDYANAAYLLFRLGNEEMGDHAFRKNWGLLKRRGLDKAFFAMQKLFIEYALKCGNLSKAHQIAEEVLKAEPDFVPALAARTHRFLTSHKRSEAIEVARRILELEKDTESAPYKLAKAVLGLERKE